MNPQANMLQKAIDILRNGNSGVICLPTNPSPDTVAAATSLYLGLIQLGKNVSLVCSTPPKSDLTASDKIQATLATSGDNLVISLPYSDGSVDKVDYYIQNERFNIVVIPSTEQSKLKPQDVKFSYSGGDVDFIITIDCDSLKRLGNIFEDNQDLFKGKKIVNIDRKLTNTYFGTANLVGRGSSSTSQLVLTVLEALKCKLDVEIATNLYAGLVAATNNFSSYSVRPETFEDAAFLLKNGARKKAQKQVNQPDQPVSSGDIETEVFVSQKPPLSEKETEKTMEEVEQEEDKEDPDGADDWLKPKIFRPSGGGENS